MNHGEAIFALHRFSSPGGLIAIIHRIRAQEDAGFHALLKRNLYYRGQMPLPTTIRRIVLTGFMGAGKSTTGLLIAQTLGWRFIDSDAAIEARTGRTIGKIFAEDGEAAFRVMEADTVREQTRGHDLVLALGGGAIEHLRTRDVLKSLDETRIVFLDAPLEVMVARCLAQPEAAERPVLADREGLLVRLTNRLPHYRTAHLTVSTADLTPEKVAERILWELSRMQGNETLPGAMRAYEKGPPTQ
jgi:shikimate kinase